MLSLFQQKASEEDIERRRQQSLARLQENAAPPPRPTPEPPATTSSVPRPKENGKPPVTSVEKPTMPEDPLARAAEHIAQQLAGTLTVALAQVIQYAFSNGEFSVMKDRVEKVETGLHTSAHLLEETQRSIEKRLDSQATAIRMLHAAINQRGEQLNTLLVTLHRLQETGAGAAQPGLPDDL